MPDDLPPWSARNQREKDRMRDWMCEQLKRVISSTRIDEANPLHGLDAKEFEVIVLENALAEARSGDVSALRRIALRRLHHEIGDYIHPKPLKRGEK
jgi:hypothetical protein